MSSRVQALKAFFITAIRDNQTIPSRTQCPYRKQKHQTLRWLSLAVAVREIQDKNAYTKWWGQ